MILSKAERQYFNILKAKGKLKTFKERPFKRTLEYIAKKLPINEN